MKNDIQQNISLKPYNTFGVQANCRHFTCIETDLHLISLYESGLFLKPFFILGAGSNVLFTRDYPGLIIKMANKGITHFIEGNHIYITAKAGEIWNDFVWYCIEHNFAGIENMALIPGTVGASPVQNIGAYGTELMDVFYICEAFDTHSGTVRTFKKEDCGFTYRDSIFKTKYKGRFIITSVTYKLCLHATPNTTYGAINDELARQGIINTPSIKQIAEAVSRIRVEKLPDPSEIGNAGSFFKNPIISVKQFNTLKEEFPKIAHYPIDDAHIKVAAGWLIESCGWKGKTDGNVRIWKNQALVITNLGNASGLEIYDTSSKILNDVYKKFGIKLEREVNIL